MATQEDFVYLVIDKGHERHGEIGRQIYYDRKEYGEIGIRFSDGSLVTFSDTDNPPKLDRFYRHDDSDSARADGEAKRLQDLRDRYLEAGGDLEGLARIYKVLFEEDFPS